MDRNDWRGQDVYGRDGEKIGSLDEIYVDTRTGRPDWAVVNTGLFGMRSSFVPLLAATETRDGIQVPFEKGHVKDAPSIDPEGRLTLEEETALYRHYGIEDVATGVGETGATRLRRSGEFERPLT